MKINLFWTTAIAELRFIKSSVRTEIIEVTEIIKITVMILASKKWLLKMIMILSLTGAVLAAATI